MTTWQSELRYNIGMLMRFAPDDYQTFGPGRDEE